MTTSRWARVTTLFHAALEQSAAEREAFLTEACRDDSGLRREVEKLLAADANADHFLSVAAAALPTLAPGMRLGPYEVVARIGAGGMGQVYQGRDSRVDRFVAIKILPATIAATSLARQRFDQEARAIAALSHPNICRLYDVGVQDGVQFLVMEFLQGETLAARLERGALSVDESSRIASDILGALDAAHRAGIVHRDLKPGNVMLTVDGAKLFDFGLARISERRDGTQAVVSDAASLTAEGTMLGTAAYMAPEQVEGRAADGRSDVFAFGAVLYEMLTGRRAFTGGSGPAVAVSILQTNPAPASSVVSSVPSAFDRLVNACLEKAPEDRFQTARDVRRALDWIVDGVATADRAAAVPTNRAGRRAIAIAAVIAVVAGAMFVVRLLGRGPSSARVPDAIRFELQPPPQTWFGSNEFVGPAAVSPDGGRIAFVAMAPDGHTRLWLRSLNALSAEPLDGTDGARRPFWSPDGSSLGFVADKKLKVLTLAGGPVRVLGDMSVSRGLTWGRDGTILFGGNRGIWKLPPGGGAAVLLAGRDASRPAIRMWPHFLPDDHHYLYVVAAEKADESGVFVADLADDATSPPHRVLADASQAVFARGASEDSGHVLFVRDKTLMAQRFDLIRLEVTGAAVPIASNVSVDTVIRGAGISVSQTGVLVYRTFNGPAARFSWIDRDGRRTSPMPLETTGRQPRLSPDATRFVLELIPKAGSGEIWLMNAAGRETSRFTFEHGWDMVPAWSPDGARIAYASIRRDTVGLYIRRLDRRDGEEALVEGIEQKYPTDWSPDGRFLAYVRADPAGKPDLWVWSFDEHRAASLVQTPADERDARFSPDGHWIAYSSDELGGSEIYVRPFGGVSADSSGIWQVSVNGGYEPAWRGDGREIYFVSPEGRVMAVPVDTSRSLEHGSPRQLLDTRIPASREFRIGADYDVTHDGQRFLVRTVEPDTSPLTVILNWTSLFK